MGDQIQKRAMKRLMQDLEEIRNSPVENVSAEPLDDNMFEWHCNFRFNDVVYHIILFFPKDYPYSSPSAEFVPKGYQFSGGATMPGKKGMKVCLSIFADFAYIHTEWANEKGMGWSPGYTVQTILLNMVSFLAETQDNQSGWGADYAKRINENNEKLAKGYTCKDCGHTCKKPYPPIEGEEAPKGKGKGKGKSSTKAAAGSTSKSEERFQVVDYISKAKFDPKQKPKDKNDLFGYGIVVSGSASRPSLTSPCEFLTGDSFYGMQKSAGVVHSMMKDELKHFLPLFLSSNHGSGIQQQIEQTMTELSQVIPNNKRTKPSEMLLKVIPNLMSATVVEFSKGTQHTSDNHLCGYFALHRLILWAIETYPELQKIVDDKLEKFTLCEENRSKKACAHIGEWLMLLSCSSKYRWTDVAEYYLGESWRRNVMWYVKDDAKLGYLDTDKKYRLEKTLAATAVSRKLLAFQVLFLDIAMPEKFSRQQIIERYDKTLGFPTEGMMADMKTACDKIKNMKTYEDWFKVLKLKPWSNDTIFEKLKSAVEFSINTDGYKWTFWKNQGGWAQVLKKYPKGTPGWKGPVKAPKGKKEEAMDTDTPAKGKGKGKGKTSKKEEPMEVDTPKKGAKKRKADEDDEGAAGSSKGRGGKKVKFEEKPAPKGRGAAKGRGGAAAGGARGRGRGKKK